MGATASSAQRDSRDDEDAAAAEQRTAEDDAPDDGSADDTLPQRNGQISSLNPKTKNHADEITGHFKERVLTDVCSGFVTVKEDGTETTKDLQDVVSLQPNTKNKSREMIHEEDITIKEETMEITEVNNINEVGFKKVFRFVGFKFTLKKEACEKTDGERLLANDQEEKEGDTSEDSNDLVSAQPKTPETSQKPENKTELDQGTRMVEVTPEKEKASVVEASYESEEPMSPIKQFFTQGIFGSLRKKKKDNEIDRETKEDELRIIDKIDSADSEKSERAEKVDSKCMCLDIPMIMYEEEKDSQQKGSTLLPEEESLEKDKVQGSPFKRLFRKFSSRRQRENEDGEKVTESSLELTDVQKEEEPMAGEPKPAVEEQVADASPQESKNKSDSTVSWEALICGGSAKKRARKTNKAETQDEYEKTTESPLGSSVEGDYDHLTSSNEQDGEVEAGSTWKTFKKMVTPKRKVRTGEGSSSEHEPSDGEINKDDSFSMMKLITGCKKRRSDERLEQTSSDETGKDAETGDEDDETPAIIPLSEYEIVDSESVKEVNEQQAEATSEHEMPEVNSQELEQDTPNESEPKQVADKVSNNARPLIIHVRSEDFEELTDFVSKHQQLSDIPEEGIIEESIQTPTTSAEWVTQDDTLAEDIVDLTADAVTAPEPASEEFVGDNSTEMVSAVSQLTESPRTSGNVTPVSAEYGVQMSNMIFQEGLQSICMTPSVQSVTTKDESQESLAVSFSPYIIHTTTGGETKVLVAHMRTEATAICTGLISQEIESVEELLTAPLVEALPEVSDAVPTELVSDNLTDAPEVARFGTDEVYEAKILEVKTGCREVIITTTNEVEEAATETELDVEQAIQLMAEPLTEVMVESHLVHMVDEKEECITELVTGVQLRSAEMAIIDIMQSEAVLDQVISEYTLGPETEGPLHLRLEEQPVNYTEVSAKVEKDSTDEKVHIEEVEFIHTDEHEIQVDMKDTIPNTAETEINDVHEATSSGDSIVIMKDNGKKVEETSEEKIVQQDIKDTIAEQSVNVVVLGVDRNIETEHISETAVKSLSRVQFEEKELEMASKEVLLPEIVLVEETAGVDEVTTESTNKLDTDVDNIRVMKSASEEADNINTSEKEKLAEKQGDQFTNFESDLVKVFAYANICKVFPEMIEQDVGIVNVETAHVFKATDVFEISMDVLENKEITTYPGASSKIIVTDLESVMPQDEARGVDTEEWNKEIKHSLETVKNERPETTEKGKTCEVLKMVVITENTTNLSEKEKPVEVRPVVQALAISELTQTTEQEDTLTTTVISGEGMGGDQMDQARVKPITVAIPEIKDKIPDVAELEPESPKPTLTEVIVTALTEFVQMAQNNAVQALAISELTQTTEQEDTSTTTVISGEAMGGDQMDQARVKRVTVAIPEIKDKIPDVTKLEPESPKPTLTEVIVTALTESVQMAQNNAVQALAISELTQTTEQEDTSTTTVISGEAMGGDQMDQARVKPVTVAIPEIKDKIPDVAKLEPESPKPTLTEVIVTALTEYVQMAQNNAVQALAISELTQTTEQEDTSTTTVISGEAMGGDQMDQARVKPVTVAIPEIKDKIPDVTKLEPESPKPTLTEVIVTALTESVQMPQKNAALQMDNNTVIEQRDGATEKTRLKCEPPEQLLEKPLAVELKVEKAEIKDVIPAVIYLKEETSAITTPEVAPIVQVPLLTSEIKAETPEVTVSEIQTQEAIELRAATLEMTEPKVEMPMVAEVKLETAIVTQLSVETPVVTSVVTELEVETPVVTSMVKTVDTHTSVTSLNQNTEVPTVTPDLATPVETQGIRSVVIAPVEDTSVVTLKVEAPPADPIIGPVVEMPKEFPMVEKPPVSSVIITEAAPTADITAGTTVPAETSVMSPLLETSVHSLTTVKLTEALVAQTSAMTPALEMPNVTPVVKTPVVDSVVVAPALASAVETQAVVLVTEAEPAVAVTPGETSTVSPVVETPVISITSPEPTLAAMAQTLVVTLVEETTALVSDTALVTEVVSPVSGMLSVSPEEETSTAIASCMSQVVETPDLDSVMVTQPASQLVTPDVTTKAETSVVSPLVETSAVEVAETPVVLTPALFSVIVREAAPPEVTPTMTAVVEVSAMDLVVETTSNLSVTADTPIMIPVVSVEETPDVTPQVETPVVCGLIEKSAGTSVPEASPAIAPVVVTLDVMEEVKATMLQVIELNKTETKTEHLAEAEDDVKPSLVNEKEVKTLVLPEEAKGFLQHEAPMVTSMVEDDVWEDAVDNVGDDHCQMMQTNVSPQAVSDSGI